MFSVAPMIDWTDRYCRFFHRQLSRRARLYSEMIVDEAILRGDAHYLLDFDPAEHPVALQLGGSAPDRLAAAARIGAAWGYDEINLNVGCPSDRVQAGRFGACLMREPELVAECVAAMVAATPVPVTVKCRLGVDEQDPAESLPALVDAVARAGASTVIVHARKAWLKGLSPRENRTIPPLDYPLVAAVKAARPRLPIVLNGGITNLDAVCDHLQWADGVMLGRAAYEDPMLLSHVDQRLFGDPPLRMQRAEIVESVMDKAAQDGTPAWRFARHMLGLYRGTPGARAWRQLLSAIGPTGEDALARIVALARRLDAGAQSGLAVSA